MILDARQLTTFQRCPRRWLLEQSEFLQSERKLRWNPTALLSMGLRGIVLELSSGKSKSKVKVAKASSTRLRSLAANPGLDINSDPWTLAGDLCSVLENFTEALSRQELRVQKLSEQVSLGPVQWQPLAFLDELGELHRWATVEKVNDDSIAKELHSWQVCGDMAVLDAPMTLHLVEIGSRRNGRLHSPWSKAWQHPMISGRIKFQSRGGKPLQGQWRPLWFQDYHGTSEQWVDLMAQDGLSLIHHLPIKQLSPKDRDEVRRQISSMAVSMEALTSYPWQSLALSRPACDSPSPCPWQFKCYG